MRLDPTDVERRVREAYLRGAPVDLSGRHADDEAAAVRAEFLVALLLDTAEKEPGRVARLTVSGARVVGRVDLRDAEITAAVELVDCEFDQPLDLSGARTRRLRLSRSRLPGVDLAGCSVEGDLVLDGCHVAGPVRLVRTTVSGLLDLAGARLAYADGPALLADELKVGHNMFCRELRTEGEIRLLGAHVGGDLVLSGARPASTAGHALDAGSLVVGRGLFCDRGFTASGDVRLTGVQADVLHLGPVTGTTDLRHARVRLLRDDPVDSAGVLHLDGLVYEALDPLVPAPARLAWLGRQPDGYRPRPYEQLAVAYRRLGHDADARRVLLARNRRRRATLPSLSRVWGLLQDWTVGYGYLPGRALAWLLCLLAAGTALFANHPPLRVQDRIAFNPVLYTLDLLLPVLSIGQERAFAPGDPLTQWSAYLLIAAGWLLATTVTAALLRTLGRS
ncbi:hypothetical protein ACPFP2_18495 [Micromonospora citrea]|uniref:hypothetical protein n=1 Tax=Micromonospora citrea TaxID=47855 RepID=UPI003C597CA1